MTPSADRVAAFQANGGSRLPVSTVVLGFVFAVLLLWGVWACAPPMSAGRAPPDPTPVPRRHRALRRDVPGAGASSSCPDHHERVYRHERFADSSSPRCAHRSHACPLASLPRRSSRWRPCPPGRPVARHRQRHPDALQNYGYDIVPLIALLVVASMFVGVCYHAYTRYAEIHTGRATWGQFGLTVAVGAILLVVGIWLLTKATGVL